LNTWNNSVIHVFACESKAIACPSISKINIEDGRLSPESTSLIPAALSVKVCVSGENGVQRGAEFVIDGHGFSCFLGKKLTTGD